MWATYNLEPKIINTALMQVWQYCRENNIEVEQYNHLFRHEYERIFAFSLFDFTPKHYVTKEMICGGTGFDVHSRLPAEIEACGYDYSAYPECDHSIVWFSRGCFRACEFCAVCKKEGRIRPVQPKNLNPAGKWIRVQDNNFFANPEWRQAVEQLRAWGQPVDLEGVDLRIMDDEQVDALKRLKHRKQIKIAWDNPADDLEPKLEWLADHISPSKIMCYVLIGYPFKNRGKSTHEENLKRIKIISDMGIDPFVMPYNKQDRYQRHFARWVNGFVYKVASWKEYQIGDKIAGDVLA